MKRTAAVLAIFLLYAGSAFAFSMRSGYYVGKGAVDYSITGIGITPDLVIIKADTAVGEPIWKSASMGGTISSTFTGTVYADDAIISLDANGFSVGPSTTVNTVNVRYTWTAFSGTGSDFAVGSYVGNGTDNRNLDILSFQPDILWIKSSGGSAGCWRSSSVAGDNSLFFGATAIAANYIQDLRSSGFQVGTNASVNSDGTTYWYVAFKSGAGSLNVGSYVGDGVDDRSISGVGFKPDMVLIKQATGTTQRTAVFRTNQNYGDETHIFGATANQVNNIQAFEADGFQVGNDARVNVLEAPARTYYYAAFKGVPAPPSPTGSFKMANGTYPGNGGAARISVTGLGFSPDLVMIKGGDTNYAVFSTSMMAPDYTAYLANGAVLFTGGISLESDGFSVGSSATVNYSDVVYRWIAFGNSGCADFKVGAYTGTAGDNRSIGGVDFTPDLVGVKGNTTQVGTWRSAAIAGDSSAYFSGTANAANLVQALESTGFQIGTSALVNTAATAYFYFAFKETSAKSKFSSYAGAAAGQSISGLGFAPQLVWTKNSAAAVGGTLRESTISGLYSQFFLNGANAVNNIVSLDSDGFSVGTDARANSNGVTFYFAGFRGTAGASKLGFTVQPSNTAAGATITPAVKVAVQDQYGQTITGDNSTQITIAIGTNPSGGTLSGTLTKTVSSGIATFDNLSINLTGAGYTLAATATGLTGATSNSFNITPANATKLRYVSQPSNTQAGSTISSFQVEVLDASNNRVTDDNFTQITLSILNNPGGGTLTGTATRTVSSGVATFNDLSINKAGTGYTLRAQATGLTSADSNSFNITTAPANKLVFIVQPANTVVNATFPIAPSIAVKDQYDNVITSDNATSVTIFIGTNPGSGTLSGTKTKTVAAGLVTFEGLSIDQPGDGYTLAGSATGLISAASNSFNVVAYKLAFIAQPTSTAAGQVISPEVRVAVQDQSGVTQTSDSSTQITLSLDNNPGNASLGGTLTRTASSGVAAFNDLRIDKAGTGYSLKAAAPLSTFATSDAFNITGTLSSLEVSSVSPAGGATGITPETQVVVTFSMAMNRTAAENAFSLKAVRDRSGSAVNIPVSGSFGWSNYDTVLTFTPGSSLSRNYTYRAEVANNASDIFNNTLASSEAWDFSIALDRSTSNVVVADDGATKVVFSEDSLPVDFFLRISTDPAARPIVVNPAAISAADAKTAQEGNPFKHPVTGTAREFVLYNADSGSRITDNLSKDADLIIPYPDADGNGIVDGTSPPIRAADLLLYKLDEGNGLWFRVPNSTVNTISKYVTAPVKSFSTFTAMATAATALSDAYAYPNPFKPSEGHTTVTFTNLASQCTIKIFTLSGNLVKTISESSGTGMNTWDVKNEAGQVLQSGLYFYVIKSPSDVKTGKLVIIK